MKLRYSPAVVTGSNSQPAGVRPVRRGRGSGRGFTFTAHDFAASCERQVKTVLFFFFFLNPVLQHQPEAGPVVRRGDQLRPLEGAAVPGRSQNSSHEVSEPDQPEREQQRVLLQVEQPWTHSCLNAALICHVALEHLAENPVQRPLHQTGPEQGGSWPALAGFSSFSCFHFR